MFNTDSGANTDFTYKAEVQIVSGKSGRLRNEDQDRNVASKMEDGLQTIEVIFTMLVICFMKNLFSVHVRQV